MIIKERRTNMKMEKYVLFRSDKNVYLTDGVNKYVEIWERLPYGVDWDTEEYDEFVESVLEFYKETNVILPKEKRYA